MNATRAVATNATLSESSIGGKSPDISAPFARRRGRGVSRRRAAEAVPGEDTASGIAVEVCDERARLLLMCRRGYDRGGIMDRLMPRCRRRRDHLHLRASLLCVGCVNDTGIDFAALDIV